MGHEPTHQYTSTARHSADAEGVLHIYLGLQPLDVLHEVLDSTSVLTNLSPTTFPDHMLHSDGGDRNLRMLDIFQRSIRVLAYRLLLEPGNTPWRPLSGSVCGVVSAYMFPASGR